MGILWHYQGFRYKKKIRLNLWRGSLFQYLLSIDDSSITDLYPRWMWRQYWFDFYNFVYATCWLADPFLYVIVWNSHGQLILRIDPFVLNPLNNAPTWNFLFWQKYHPESRRYDIIDRKKLLENPNLSHLTRKHFFGIWRKKNSLCISSAEEEYDTKD